MPRQSSPDCYRTKTGLLEIVLRAKDWKEGEARRQLLALFNLAGEPKRVGEYRRKLASALY